MVFARMIAGFLLVGGTVFLALSLLGFLAHVASPPGAGQWSPALIMIIGGPVIGLIAGVIGAILGAANARPAWLTGRVATIIIGCDLAVIGVLFAILFFGNI